MAKDPAFLFFPGDWMGGTATFTRFMKGCYMDLLIAQFNNGHLSLEEIKTVLGSDFGQSWPTLQKKFILDDDGKYFNVKLQTETLKRRAFTESRGNNRKGKNKNISSSYEKDMSEHMENENGNINRVVKERGAGENHTLEKNLTELGTYEEWRDVVCKNFKLSYEEFTHVFGAFTARCLVVQEYKSVGELKKYFSSWCPMHKDKVLTAIKNKSIPMNGNFVDYNQLDYSK